MARERRIEARNREQLEKEEVRLREIERTQKELRENKYKIEYREMKLQVNGAKRRTEKEDSNCLDALLLPAQYGAPR